MRIRAHFLLDQAERFSAVAWIRVGRSCSRLFFLIKSEYVAAHASATSNTVSYEMRKEVIEFTLTNGTLYYKNTIEYPYFTGSSAAEVAINNRYASFSYFSI